MFCGILLLSNHIVLIKLFLICELNKNINKKFLKFNYFKYLKYFFS